MGRRKNTPPPDSGEALKQAFFEALIDPRPLKPAPIDEEEDLLPDEVEEHFIRMRKHRRRQSEPEAPKPLATKKLPPKKVDLSHYFDEAKLTNAQREAMSLKFEYGLSVSRIARQLSIGRKSVYERLAAAEAKVKANSAAIKRAKKRAVHNIE